MSKALLFPGQGAQFVGMGQDLYTTFSSAKEVFNQIDDALSCNLSKIIFEGPADTLTHTENAQPALMAVSMAMIKVLENEKGWDLSQWFQFVAGHSLGEYTALCATGALSVADAAKLLRKRGCAMAKAAQNKAGIMAALVGLSISDVLKITQETGCFISNDNAIGQIVVSGAKETVEKACTLAMNRGAKKTVVLPVSGAFHSPLMQEAAEEMKDILLNTPMQSPRIPIVCNVKASPQTDVGQIKELLFEQMTGCVRWTQTIQYMFDQEIDTLVEVGAGRVLTGLAKRIEPTMRAFSINNVSSLEETLEMI